MTLADAIRQYATWANDIAVRADAITRKMREIQDEALSKSLEIDALTRRVESEMAPGDQRDQVVAAVAGMKQKMIELAAVGT